MKRCLLNGFAAFAVVAMLMGSQPAFADEPINPAADLIILRPFGLAMLAGGTVLMVAVAPWTLLVRPTEMDVPFDTFMKGPFMYTFVDPLGSH
jgi:uncharacterized membrane protein